MQAAAVASLQAGKPDSPKMHNTEPVKAQRMAFLLQLWALNFVSDQFKTGHFSRYSLCVTNPIFVFYHHLCTLPIGAARFRATQRHKILPVIILEEMSISDSPFT